MDTYLSQIPVEGMTLCALAVVVLVEFVRCKRAHRIPYLYETCLLFASALYAFAFVGVFLYPPAWRFSLAGWDESIPLSALVHLVPFRTIGSMSPTHLMMYVCAFIPMPVLAHANGLPRRRASVLPLVVALAVEPVQLLLDYVTAAPRYVFDVDNMLLGLVGVVIGCCLVWAWDSFSPLALPKSRWGRSALQR